MRLAAEKPCETRTQEVMQCGPQQQRAACVNGRRNTDRHLPCAFGEATAPNTTDGEHERPHGHEQHGEKRRYMLDSDKRVLCQTRERA